MSRNSEAGCSKSATNYIKRNNGDQWSGYFCAKLYQDGNGIYFPLEARYVCFDGQELVGEYSGLTEASAGFLRGDRKEGGVRLSAYKGFNNNAGVMK